MPKQYISPKTEFYGNKKLYDENGNYVADATIAKCFGDKRDPGLYKIHGTLKQSSVLSDKAVVFVPDEDANLDFVDANLISNKEYIFTKKYSDIAEGEYDVYIDCLYDDHTVIVAAEK